jgi:hypothetical protein
VLVLLIVLSGAWLLWVQQQAMKGFDIAAKAVETQVKTIEARMKAIEAQIKSSDSSRNALRINLMSSLLPTSSSE